MPDARRNPYQYAIVRIVPRVERGECLNVGVILLCRPSRFLAASMALSAIVVSRLGLGDRQAPRLAEGATAEAARV